MSRKPLFLMMRVQDANDVDDSDGVIVYHTHGMRQWFGTCKLHKNPFCPHLLRWRPGHVLPGKGQLGKVIMRERKDDIPESKKCGTCWGKE